MKKTTTTCLLVSAIAATLIFFDVSVGFDIVMPRETEILDPQVEVEYARCYESRDDDIHATAFGTIDNPDVQKEFISANRARAAKECRALHPEARIRVKEPLRFKVVDLEPRFW